MKQHAALAPYLPVHAYGLGDLLHEQSRSRPDMLAVIDGAHRFTFAELDLRVNRLAGVLRSRGVGRGDRILWLGQNSFRVLEALLASARVGAIFCPANWRATPAELAVMLDDFDPAVVFWQETEIGAGNREARAAWKPGANWICHDGCPGEDSYEALLTAADPATEFAAVEPSTPLLAVYTAAFSGRPGAALLSHEALMIIAWLAMQGQKIDENSGYLVSGPMFHVAFADAPLTDYRSSTLADNARRSRQAAHRTNPSAAQNYEQKRPLRQQIRGLFAIEFIAFEVEAAT